MRYASGIRNAFALAMLTSPLVSQAAVYCVRNETELQQALTAAAASGQDDEIKIREGVYTTFSQSFTYTATTSGWLGISGGWVTIGGIDCAQRVMDATRTVLSGAGQRQVLKIYHMPTAGQTSAPRLLVQNLSIRDGHGDESQFQRGGGLDIGGYSDLYTEIWLDNLIVANNSGYFGGGANLYAKYGIVRVVNSLFANNRSDTVAYGHFAANVVATHPNVTSAMTIANSTFAGGRCPGQGMRGCGIGVGLPAGVRMDIVNSLFFDNQISDLNIEGMSVLGLGDGEAHADYSLVGTVGGNLPLAATHALSGDPRFVDAPNGDFRLRNDSPFINQGLAPVPMYPAFGQDLAGALRTRFEAMDPGAYENQTWDFIFADGLD